jgi:hypothetical protein
MRRVRLQHEKPSSNGEQNRKKISIKKKIEIPRMFHPGNIRCYFASAIQNDDGKQQSRFISVSFAVGSYELVPITRRMA